VLKVTVSKLLEKIRRKIFNQPDNSKERKRAERNKALLGYLSKIEGTKQYEFFDHQKVLNHLMIMDELEESKVKEHQVVLLRTRLCRTVEFIIKHTQNQISEKDTTVLEFGDASGIMLEYFNKTGTSLNIDETSHKMILGKGFDSIHSDIMDLKPELKFDYIFAFQVLEHVSDPIGVLNKLRQAVNKMIFISIPYKGSKTRIKSLGYYPSNSEYTHDEKVKNAYHYHIFEFSPNDFRSIISHAQLIEVAYEECYNFYPKDTRFQFWALKPL